MTLTPKGPAMPRTRLAFASAILILSALATSACSAPSQNDPSNDESNPPSTKTALLPSEQDLAIPAGLSTEELGTTILHRYESWNNAGCNNQSVYDAWRDDSRTAKDFAPGQAQEFAPYFADSLYVEGWDDEALHPDLVNNYRGQISLNENTLAFNLITGNPDNGDSAPYERDMNLLGVTETSTDDGARVLEIRFNETANDRANRVGELDGQTPEEVALSSRAQRIQVTLIRDGNRELIASIDWGFGGDPRR